MLGSSARTMICLPLRSKSVMLAVLGTILSAMPGNHNQGGAVSLSAKVSKIENRLVIDYTLQNEEDKTIYVWDVMTSTSAEQQVVDPGLAYVFWEEPKSVRVVRGILDEPPDIHPVVRELPFVRKVSGHVSVRGQISLEVPVHEYSPFYSPDTESKPVQCDSLHLMVGWIEHQQGMVFSERQIGDQRVLALRGSWPRPPQHIAEKVLPIPTVLLVRQDNFDRSLPPQ